MTKKSSLASAHTEKRSRIDLLRALNTAAATVQESAHSETDVLHAFSEQLSALGLFGTICWIEGEENHLTVRSIASTPDVLSNLEEHTGFKADGFKFPMRDADFRAGVIEAGKTLFIPDTHAVLERFLPEIARPFTGLLLKTIGEVPWIFAPLKLAGRVQGVLSVAGADLMVEDTQVVEAFANHVAIALDNARLFVATRQAEAHYRRLFESANDGIVIMDAETSQVLSINRRVAELTGYSEEDIFSRSFYELIPAEFVERARQITKTIQERGEGFFEFPLQRPNGEKWLLQCSVTVFEADGRRLVQALMRDITERMQLEEALRRRAEELATIAADNARLLEAERAAREQAEILRDVGRVVSSSLDRREVLHLLLDQLKRVLIFNTASVMFYDDENKPVITAGVGFADERMTCQAASNLLKDSAILRQMTQTLKPVLISDVRQYPDWIWVPGAEHVVSFLGVPIVVRGKLAGALMADSVYVGSFTETDVRVAQSLVQQMAITIENANLFEESERRANELEAVRQASLSMAANLEIGALLDIILESALRLLPGIRNAQIYLYYPEEGGRLAFGAALWSDGRRGQLAAPPRPLGLTYTVAHSGQPLLVSDVSNHPLFMDMPFDHGWAGSIVGLPLKIGQGVVGVMNVSHAQENAFSEADLHLLRLLGDQAAIAIENARLFDQASRERRHLRLLYDIGREMTASLDADDILHRAITLTCQALGGLVGYAFLFMPKENRLSLRAQYGQDGNSLTVADEQIGFAPDEGLAGWVVHYRQSVNLADVTQDPRWQHIRGVDKDVHSAIVAPILDGDRLLGVLSVLHREAGAFTADHLDLLEGICQQVRLALLNAERYGLVQNLVDMLAAEQYRLESLVERLPVGVLLLDADYRLMVANAMGREILSALGTGAVGTILANLGPHSLAEITARHTEAMPVEVVLENPARRIIEAEARPIGGDFIQWVLTVRDVTVERESQARTQMQERLATVGQLAAGIAHDFNNIMAAILVYSDLLMTDTGLPPTSRERLTIIQQQVQRASSLIRQILDFSRRSVMEQNSLDLQPFVKELGKLLGRVLPENIQLDLTFADGSYIVKADPTRLQQAFMNLALNARDAMPLGGRLCFELSRCHIEAGEISLYSEIPPGEWIRIVISDTGQGIPPDVLSHIFEPFFTTKPVGQGTGLGLSQVYGIIKQHGGHIDVSSQVSEGSRFSVFLPALAAALDETHVTEMPARLDGAGQTVLVVEDDQATRDALQALLHTHRFLVFAASNGAEALRILEKIGSTVSLIVTDVVMPEIGGMGLYRAVQEHWPQIKVLFVTGHPFDASDRALLETGNVHWLQKPFSARDFSAAIRALFLGL